MYQAAMETRFLAWLKAHKEPPYLYARRRNLGERVVKRLAGVGGAWGRKRGVQFPVEFLDRVSGETGIPADALFAEAVWASEHPTPARIYRRKMQEDTDADKKASAAAE
jgi:hypothetical protein